MADASARITEFVTTVTAAMGLSLTVTAVEVRRRGEALNALQHIVASVFRDDLPEGQRVAVDCLGYRQGKDAELRQMALFIAEKAVTSGAAQEMGPLNPYERRIVHMAVAERSDATSESIGDAFMKTVIIAARD
jgi:spoIIIJ-associated protein